MFALVKNISWTSVCGISLGLQESPNNTCVLTNGGRSEVNVGQRVKSPVYWNDAPVPVRRCSWFYKREGDNRYIPYEEDFCIRLEVKSYIFHFLYCLWLFGNVCDGDFGRTGAVE